MCSTLAAVNSGYAEWDAAKTQVCVCDPGYEGVDCASRMCPVGDDPMTKYSSVGVSEVNEQQTITISAATTLAGEFTLTYTDWRGESWTTWALDSTTTSVIAIQEALVGLPNHAIPSVTVTAVTETAASRSYLIEFTDPENTGDQAALVINDAGCAVSGCQPFYSGLGASTGAVTTNNVETQRGTKENAVCSNRGSCEAETGICRCAEGFHGQACEIQTVLV